MIIFVGQETARPRILTFKYKIPDDLKKQIIKEIQETYQLDDIEIQDINIRVYDTQNTGI